jgi:glucose/arabinose dehydrogenase
MYRRRSLDTLYRAGNAVPVLRRVNNLKFLVVCVSVSLHACGGSGGGSAGGSGQGPLASNAIVKLTRVFPNLAFNAPVALVQAPADPAHWYVIEQAGRVLRFDGAGGAASVVVDIGAQVTTGGETGLLGIAFHPDWPAVPEVFLSYTRSAPNLQSVISRFVSADGGITLDASSEQIIMLIDQPESNHNGGQICFGPDGFLYAGFGDGGGAGDQHGSIGNGQSLGTLLGKILRIDVRGTGAGYAVPPDNPFAANPQCAMGAGSAACPEIWAFGFRNPWRWSFDAQAGELWVGDVGQDSWEEVDRVNKGGNYGWRLREGAHCYNPVSGCPQPGEIQQGAALVDPVTEYDHGVGEAITGGFVYRGTRIKALFGSYVFGDYISGRIWTHTPGSPNLQKTEQLHSSANISSFGQGLDGELYVLDYATGQILQLQPVP